MGNIKEVIKSLLLKDLEKEEERIRTSSDGEDFIIGYDSDYYNNGVGWALTSVPEPVFDDEEIKEKAKGNIIKALEDCDDDEFGVRLMESEAFIKCLIDLIEKL